MNRKIIMLPLSFAAVLSLIACSPSENKSDSSANEPVSSQTGSSSSSSSEVVAVKISVSKTAVTLTVGESAVVKATVTGTSNTKVTWASSDETIATVEAGGITGVKAGTTTITATSVADPTVKATVAVTVEEEPKIKLSTLTAPNSSSQTYYGVITAKTKKGFMIDDGTGALYIYKTLGSSYKVGDYVSVTGTVTSFYGFLEFDGTYNKVSDGSTAPTLRTAADLTIAKMNEVQAQCTDATVMNSTTAFHASDIGPFVFTATADCSTGFTNFYLAEDTEKKNPISPMNYSGESFVDGAEYTVKGYFAGKHTKGYWQFVVAESTPNFKDVESVTLDKTTASITSLDDKITLKETVLPKGSNTNVTWTSSDETIATVADGVVSPVAVGTVTITATSVADSTKSASCVVTITNDSSVSYTSVAKYDFSTLKYDTSEDTNKTYGKRDAAGLTTIFGTPSYLSTGTNVVTSCTAATSVYIAKTTEGPKVNGLKVGTSKAAGSMTLSVSPKIAKVVITGFAWSDTKLATLTVNDANTVTYVAADATTAKDSSFVFAESNSVEITSSIYSVITGIEFFTKTVA